MKNVRPALRIGTPREMTGMFLIELYTLIFLEANTVHVDIMESYSTDVIFTAVREALPLWQSKLKAVMIMCIDGEDWLCDGKNGIVEKLDSAPPTDVELTVSTSLTTFQELMDSKMTAQQAFMKGKLNIKGNMGLAMKLTSVIGATQKYLPQQSRL